MSAAGLKARSKRRRFPIDEGVRPEHAIAANVLDRPFEATTPNQRWVADFPASGPMKAGCTSPS